MPEVSNTVDRGELLEAIAAVAPGLGAAEHESPEEPAFFRNFLPLPDHRRALDPDILLVLGGRGAGKTELFRALAYEHGLEALSAEQKPHLPLDPATTYWVAGYGRTHRDRAAFPTPESLEQLDAGNPSTVRAFWIGLIVGQMLNKAPDTVGDLEWASLLAPELEQCLRRSALVSQWLRAARSRLEDLNYALDRLDRTLLRQNRWLFITYDELDRLLPNYAQLSVPIRELLAFWLDRWRRWERIRPKIFLRKDLFREEFLGFPDASKLRGHRVELTWQPSSLYRLLVKRIANASGAAQAYLESSFPDLHLRATGVLGFLPENREDAFKKLIDTIIGPYMGANPQKGRTYYWIPNHLQDTAGQIAPRSILKLFALAAEARRPKVHELSGPALLRPIDLQGALMETSKDRIRELQEEYQWIEHLNVSLRGLEVPKPRSEFLRVLARTAWSEQAAPPDRSTSAVLQYLREIGVVELRSDDKVNVPEIYLYGFQLKRRGGIQRPIR
jgi:hypothetical protein